MWSWQNAMNPSVLWQVAKLAESRSATLDPSLRLHGPNAEVVKDATDAVLLESGVSSASVARKVLARVERQVKIASSSEPVSAAARAHALLEAGKMYPQALQKADGVASEAVLHARSHAAGHAGVVATCMSVGVHLVSQGDEVGSSGYRPFHCLEAYGSGDRSTADATGVSSGAGTTAKPVPPADATPGQGPVGEHPTILSDWSSMGATPEGSDAFPAGCSAWKALFQPQQAAAEGEIVLSLKAEMLPRRDGFESSPPSRIPAPVIASRLAANVFRGDSFKLFECFAGTLPPEAVRGLVTCAMLPLHEATGGAGGSGLGSQLQVIAAAKAAAGKVSVRQQLRFGSSVDSLLNILAFAARSADSQEDLAITADLHQAETLVIGGSKAVSTAERPG